MGNDDVDRCWATDPRDRPSCAEVCKLLDIIMAKESASVANNGAVDTRRTLSAPAGQADQANVEEEEAEKLHPRSASLRMPDKSLMLPDGQTERDGGRSELSTLDEAPQPELLTSSRLCGGLPCIVESPSAHEIDAGDVELEVVEI